VCLWHAAVGEGRSRAAPPDPVAPPPPSAEAQGGLAGVRKSAEPLSHATDGSAAVGVQPADTAGMTGLAGGGGGLVDQVADLGTVGERSAAAEGLGNTAAVSTHSGPEADPYHLGQGST
jgi:hypothetical protein